MDITSQYAPLSWKATPDMREGPRASRSGSSFDTKPPLPLGCPGQDLVGMVSYKATRVRACCIENRYLHTNPHFSFCFCYYKARTRDRCFSWIQAESPLMIHVYFSQTPDVSDKYILVLFLIGKSNHS